MEGDLWGLGWLCPSPSRPQLSTSHLFRTLPSSDLYVDLFVCENIVCSARTQKRGGGQNPNPPNVSLKFPSRTHRHTRFPASEPANSGRMRTSHLHHARYYLRDTQIVKLEQSGTEVNIVVSWFSSCLLIFSCFAIRTHTNVCVCYPYPTSRSHESMNVCRHRPDKFRRGLYGYLSLHVRNRIYTVCGTWSNQGTEANL